MKLDVFACEYTPDVPPGGEWSDPKPGPDGYLTDEHPDHPGEVVFVVLNAGYSTMPRRRFEAGDVIPPKAAGDFGPEHISLSYLHKAGEYTDEQQAWLDNLVVVSYGANRLRPHYAFGASLKNGEQWQRLEAEAAEEGRHIWLAAAGGIVD